VYGARVTFFSEYTVYVVSNLSSSDLGLEYCKYGKEQKVSLAHRT